MTATPTINYTFILMANDIEYIEENINLVKFRSNRLEAYFDSIYKINSKTNIYYTLILANNLDDSVDEFIEILNSTSINLLNLDYTFPKMPNKSSESEKDANDNIKKVVSKLVKNYSLLLTYPIQQGKKTGGDNVF